MEHTLILSFCQLNQVMINYSFKVNHSIINKEVIALEKKFK